VTTVFNTKNLQVKNLQPFKC